MKKLKRTILQSYLIEQLKGEEIIENIYKKELQKTNQKEFRIEKIFKRKDNKLFIKWKGYDDSFNT